MGQRLERFVTYAAAAAVVASLMPLAAKLGWAFDLATHFRVQYVVGDALLAVALAAQRRFVFALLLTACAGLSASVVLPYVAFGAKPAAASAAPIVKLLSANVLFQNHSAKRLLAIVRDETPDVVVLLEYTPEWAAMVDELRAAYPYQVESPDRGPYGIALFSRLAVESAAPFALGDTAAIEAKVLAPSGALTLFGVHLRSPITPSRATMRNHQLDELAARVAGVSGPIAVIGDFNVTPYSPYFTDWIARTGLTDTRVGRTLRPSWPVFLPFLAIPIDHCAVSRDVGVVAHRNLPAFGSDHYPILVELALTAPTSN